DFQTFNPYEALVVVADQECLDRYAGGIFGCPLASLVRREQVLIGNAAQTRVRLRAMAASLEVQLRPGCAELTEAAAAARFEDTVLRAVLNGLTPARPRLHGRHRQRIACTAERYLRTHLGHPVTILDLCHITGATPRTLHMAFRAHFGATPKAYQKMLLLNVARHDLRAARVGTTVTDVAIRWGLLHFGWFAHDYH